MKTLVRILSYYSSYKLLLAASIFFSAIVAACTVFPAWIMKSVVNDVLVEGNMRILHIIAGTLIVVMFIKGIAHFTQSYIMQYVAQSILMHIRSKCIQKMLNLSLAFYKNQRTGQLMSRITSDVLVLKNLLSSFTALMGDFIALIGFCAYIFYLHWKLAVISIIIIPFIGALINRFSRKMKKIGMLMQHRIGDISTVLQEFITGIKVVKSFTLEKYVEDKFEIANGANFRETMRGSKIESATTPAIEFINTCGLAIIFWYGGYEVIHENLNAGELISFMTALVGLFTPIKNLSRMSNTISQSVGAGERVFEIIDEVVDIKEKPDALPCDECEGKVSFDNVSFEYEKGEKILKSLSLDVAPGQIIALVGPSGSGKTTFVNLIPRFFEVTEGSIKVDDQDIRNYSINSLRKKIGMVPQDTMLFSGTIEENIKFGNLDATRDEVITAAKLANAHTFIMTQPDGYDTMLGERGVNLSGGQGQRIALARAFLKDPAILILDEATSALDSETENQIRDSLNKLMKDRTTFIIAHRLSTIINADKILVMQAGEIIETGTHEKLLKECGVYSQLYKSQFNESNISSNVF